VRNLAELVQFTKGPPRRGVYLSMGSLLKMFIASGNWDSRSVDDELDPCCSVSPAAMLHCANGVISNQGSAEGRRGVALQEHWDCHGPESSVSRNVCAR